MFIFIYKVYKRHAQKKISYHKIRKYNQETYSVKKKLNSSHITISRNDQRRKWYKSSRKIDIGFKFLLIKKIWLNVDCFIVRTLLLSFKSFYDKLIGSKLESPLTQALKSGFYESKWKCRSAASDLTLSESRVSPCFIEALLNNIVMNIFQHKRNTYSNKSRL